MKPQYEDSSVHHSDDRVLFATGSIYRCTGSEGPSHDPYGWECWTLERKYKGKDITAVLRQGIGLDLSINGEKVQGQSDDTLHILFERATGISVSDMEKAFWKAVAYRRSHCWKCGSKDILDVSGHPGETLFICDVCGTIIDGEFNESAII